MELADLLLVWTVWTVRVISNLWMFCISKLLLNLANCHMSDYQMPFAFAVFFVVVMFKLLSEYAEIYIVYEFLAILHCV